MTDLLTPRDGQEDCINLELGMFYISGHWYSPAAVARLCADALKDAERYRKLRDGQNWPAVFAWHDHPEPLRGVDLDTACDSDVQ